MQPWGSVPAMTHGDVRMYETLAICNYIDHAFYGPPLQPADPLANARCLQWTSVFIQYLYRPAIDIVLQRLVVPAQGGEADEALVASSVPKTEKALGVLDGALGGQACFAGDAASLADYMVLPVLHYLKMTPEGETLLAPRADLARWQAAIDERRERGRDCARVRLRAFVRDPGDLGAAGGGRHRSGGEGVAGRAHRPDRVVLAVAIERLAQAADVHIDGAPLDVDRAPPHRFQQGGRARAPGPDAP